MELQQLQEQIVGKSVKSAYIFAGPEGAVQRVYLYKMAEAMQCTRTVRCSTVVEAVRAMNARSLVPEKTLYVVFDDISFTKAETAWNDVFSRADKSQHILVLQYSKLDKRVKFYKHNKDRICMFDALGDDIAERYVQKEIQDACFRQLHPDVAKMVAQACGNDYGRIISECDKIVQYYRYVLGAYDDAPESDWDIDSAALELLEQGVIHQPIGDITFKLTDAILYRDPVDTQEYLEQALLKKEPELMIVSILYNSFKHILMVQGLGTDQSNVTKRTGLTPFQVKLAKEKLNCYSIGELIRNMKILQEVEYGIKTGTFEISIALPYVAVAVMEG